MSSIVTIKDKIFEACTEGNLIVINKRINRKRNILFYNKYGQTPLIVATINNHNNIVQKICEYDKKNIEEIKTISSGANTVIRWSHAIHSRRSCRCRRNHN